MSQAIEHIVPPVPRTDGRTPGVVIFRIHVIRYLNNQIPKIPIRAVPADGAAVNIVYVHPVVIFIGIRVHIEKKFIIARLPRTHICLYLIHIRHLIGRAASVCNPDIIPVCK